MNRYKWKANSRSSQLLIELEAVNLVFSQLKSLPEAEENLRRTALLKSAVFSARIEGLLDTELSPKLESQNLLTAYKWIRSAKAPNKITLNLVRNLHKLALKNISGVAGQWRNEPWAIFDSAGRVIHLAAPHFELAKLMPEWVTWINKMREHVSVHAALAQFGLEKIHPFADGNGRVGRLVSAFILEKGGMGFRGLAPFEEYIDKHRDEYYEALEPNLDATKFVEFSLEALIIQAKETVEKLSQANEVRPADKLLPRRKEILEVVRDHPNCSFDLIARRFAAVNPKTLHYDLGQLMKIGLVKKLGVSRGSVYGAN